MAKAGLRQTKCRQCGRPLPKLARQHGDPYCSVVCCKAAHHVVDRIPKLRILAGVPVHREVRAA